MLRIGTSGWIYDSWKGRFYPQDLARGQELEFYAQKFDTVELNASFYRLPSLKTFENWHTRTPKGFIFSVKTSRFITHIKKLRKSQEPWQQLLAHAQALQEKLGPFLFQFPPNWQKNAQRLNHFLKMAVSIQEKVRLAFEFRHPSWFDQEIFELCQKYNVALVISDSGKRWPEIQKVTSDLVYIRFHGPGQLYASKYSQSALQKWAQQIQTFLNQNLDVFCYFNNDYSGYAVENARDLKKLLSNS